MNGVAAGIAILEEAGGLVTTANPPANPDADIPNVKLGSRLYLAIRYTSHPIIILALYIGLTLHRPAGNSDTETGRQAQERTVREVWKRVRELNYSRPGA